MEVELATLMALASAAVHYQDYLGGGGDPLDLEAAKSNMDTPGVRRLMADLEKQSLIPLRRDGVRRGF